MLSAVVGALLTAALPFSALAEGARETGAPAPMAKATTKAKYVFVFIGDGMSMTQINSAEAFKHAIASKEVAIKKMGFTQFPVTGMQTTYDASSLITDSASSATAIASGNKTLSGVINMDVSKTKSFKLISEYARDAGMKVGVVSNVSLDHATPAAFYAKVPSRGNMYDIAVQLGKSGFDYFGGGGFAQPMGKNKDLPSVIDLAKAQGYTYINSAAAFNALKPGVGKVIAVNAVLQDSYAMPYDLDRQAGDLSLADYTRKGIELLSDDPDGFFMMVESGKIDWACHANDAASAIGDTLAFDVAIAEAVAFAAKHPAETLIIVTGDHETGGMTMGFAGTKYSTFFDKVGLQKMSYVAFDSTVLKPYKAATAKDAAKLEDLAAAIKDAFGLDIAALSPLQKEQMENAFKRSLGNEVEKSSKEEEALLYGGYEPLTVQITHTLNQMAGIGWTSYSHTGVPVPVFAKGANQDIFGGYYDNTDLFGKMAAAMGLNAAM